MNTEIVNPSEGNRRFENREFSLENMGGYAEMCIQVAWRIAEKVHDSEGKDIALLLPSRGAIPIFVGAMLAFANEPSLKEFGLGNVFELPLLSCFDYVRKEIGEIPTEGKVKVLIFPFTADIDLTGLGFDSRIKRMSDDVLASMRRFGARAITEFFKPPGERNGSELKTFLSFLETVEGRRGINDFISNFPRVDEMLVIDTVISGRASWTILDELEKEGRYISSGRIDPILVVDEDGKKLKKPFRSFVDQRPAGSIRVSRILTEDRGAALEGVAALIYPGLIVKFKEEQGIYPLFGSWHDIPLVYREKYLGVLDNFFDTINSIIRGAPQNEVLEKRENFCTRLIQSRVLKGEEGLTGKEFKIKPSIARVRETSSHVVQLYFSDEVAKQIMSAIAKGQTQ